MFKKEFNGNELAAAELLGIDPDWSVVAKNEGKTYVVTVLENEEDEESTPPFQIIMFDPMYYFDGKKEHVTDQIEGMVEYRWNVVENKHGDDVTAIEITDKYFPTAFARDTLLRFVEGFAKEIGLKAVVVNDISTDGKNAFAPYANLGYTPAVSDGKIIAIKTKLVDRKFPNNYEELYDQFEEKINPQGESGGSR